MCSYPSIGCSHENWIITLNSFWEKTMFPSLWLVFSSDFVKRVAVRAGFSPVQRCGAQQESSSLLLPGLYMPPAG